MRASFVDKGWPGTTSRRRALQLKLTFKETLADDPLSLAEDQIYI